MKQPRLRLAAACAVLGLLGACDAGRDGSAAPTPSAALPTVVMGTSPWIGLAPWRVADEQGFDTDHGFELEFVTVEAAEETADAITSGEVDVLSVSLNTAVPMLDDQLPVRIVHLEDVSLQADAVVVAPGIRTVQDLRGRRVASERGTTAHMVLDHALHLAGMSVDDLELVPLLGSEAGAALLAGRVDAAATWEPYISATVARDPAYQRLVTADVLPGLVSDVVLAQEEYLAENGDLVVSLLQAWDAGLAHQRQHPDEVVAAEAERSSVDEAELQAAFDGLEYYDLEQALVYLRGTEIQRLSTAVSDVLRRQGVVREAVDLDAVVDLRPLEEATAQGR